MQHTILYHIVLELSIVIQYDMIQYNNTKLLIVARSPPGLRSILVFATVLSHYCQCWEPKLPPPPSLQSPMLCFLCFRRVEDQRNSLQVSPLLKKTCVRQVVLGKWVPLNPPNKKQGGMGFHGRFSVKGGHHNLLHDSPRLKKACVRQVVLDKWFPLSHCSVLGAETRIVSYSAVQYTILYHTILYYTILYYTILYHTMI